MIFVQNDSKEEDKRYERFMSFVIIDFYYDTSSLVVLYIIIMYLCFYIKPVSVKSYVERRYFSVNTMTYSFAVILFECVTV